VKPVK